jgi:hypothetical protein
MKKKAKPGSGSRNGYPTCVTTPKRISKCIPSPCSSVEQKRGSILKQLIPAGPVYLPLAKMLASVQSDPKSLPPRRQSRRCQKVSFTRCISPRYLQSNFPSLILLNSNTRLLSYEIHYFDTRCPNKLIPRLAPVLESTNPIAPATYSLYSFRYTSTIAYPEPHHFCAREKQILYPCYPHIIRPRSSGTAK